MLRNITTFLVSLRFSSSVLAQSPGSNDATFNASDLGNGMGDGCGVLATSVSRQPDGKILVTGTTNISETFPLVPYGFARYNADGSKDPTWTPLANFSGIAITVTQPDGKVLFGGQNLGSSGIYRLTSTGASDGTFTPPTLPGAVKDVIVLSTGKILVAGTFTSVGGVTTRKYLTRLNSNGTVDATFSITLDGAVQRIAVQTNGSIVLAGSFNTVNGSARTHLARVTSNGALDASFDPGANIPFTVADMLLMADGSIMVAGAQASTPSLVRITSTGAIDAGFNCSLPNGQAVTDMGQLSDGRLVIIGTFTTVNGTARVRIARLTTSGSIDPTFDPGGGFNATPRSMVMQPDGKAVVIGDFTLFHGVIARWMARVGTDGADDASYDPASGVYVGVNALAVQPDGRILLGGTISSYFGSGQQQLVRTFADGSQDTGFNPSFTGYPYQGLIVGSLAVNRLIIQPDGKILVAGSFGVCNGVARVGIARINTDGTLDPTFDPGTTFDRQITDLALLPDGDVLAATSNASNSNKRMVRLNADGSVDATLNTADSQPVSGIGWRIVPLPMGRTLIGGYLTSYGGQPCGPVIRLTEYGTLDPGFTTQGAFVNASGTVTVRELAVQGDGRILVCGQFTSVQGAPRAGLARLMPDGSLDPTFVPAVSASPWSFNMVLRPDGKLIVAGRFLLNNDGSLDASWNSGSGYDNSVLAATLQPDGDLLLGGTFTNYNGTGRNRVARINGHPMVQMPLSIRALLEGPFDPGTELMHDSLRVRGFIPLAEPFASLGFTRMNETTPLPLGAGALSADVLLSNSVVDWALVELRSATQPALILQTRTGLIQRDGDIVAIDGTSPLAFNNVAGSYHVAVRHRDHFGVMTAAPVALSSSNSPIDFSLPSTPTFGTEAQKTLGARTALWAGNVSVDAMLMYTGSANDRDPILLKVGSTTPNNTASGYFTEDVNMDGTVKYTGASNDRDPILVNVGSTTPNQVRQQQLP